MNVKMLNHVSLDGDVIIKRGAGSGTGGSGGVKHLRKLVVFAHHDSDAHHCVCCGVAYRVGASAIRFSIQG